ncbi:MAG: hypothetical protein QGG54_20070, partial [Gammaproteobacteria bacterium]|nr:hypothetical protein [Gammaproteobacteria bacterium]
MDLSELLAFAVKNGASDIHISAGLPPLIRIDGDIRRIKVDPLPSNLVHDMIYDIMLDSQRKEFEERWEADVCVIGAGAGGAAAACALA